jgi:excisionase family DNA binding protein
MDRLSKNEFDHPLAISVRSAAKALGVGMTTIWGLIRKQELRTAKIGRRRLVVYRSLEDLIDSAARSKATGNNQRGSHPHRLRAEQKSETPAPYEV